MNSIKSETPKRKQRQRLEVRGSHELWSRRASDSTLVEPVYFGSRSSTPAGSGMSADE